MIPQTGDVCSLTLADFDYDLPSDRIAHHPARPRDAARMLHVRNDGLSDLRIRDLPVLLRPGDILVANDTRVFPAQLSASRGRGADRHHPGPATRGRILEGPCPQRPAPADW